MIKNASPASVKAGWDIYRKSGGSLRLSQINAALVRAGYDVISDRTYRHYRKMTKAGRTEYMPINRFDVHATEGSP